MAGILVAFEGIDGVGKTTQQRCAAERLRNLGYDVLAIHEPTDGKYGALLRRSATEGRLSAEAERDLFIADRKEDVSNNILPALKRGSIVLMDRYYFSSIAYQGARGLDPKQIQSLNEEFAPIPSLLVILDLPVNDAIRRITHNRGDIANAFEKEEYLESVKHVFDQFDLPYLHRIDGKLPIETITDTVISSILSVIKPPNK